MKLTFLAMLLPIGLMAGRAEAVTYTLSGTDSGEITALYEVAGRGTASIGVTASGVLPDFHFSDPTTLADYNVAARVESVSGIGQAAVVRTNVPGVTVPARPEGGISLGDGPSLVTLHVVALARNVTSFSYSVRIVFPESATVTPFSVVVPGPIAGAGVPALAGFSGLALWRGRRRANRASS